VAELHNGLSGNQKTREELMAGENDTFEFYQDKSSEWRWRRTAVNGEIVGAASEGYVNRSDCEANAERFGYSK
jgi:uncharacterized protein YegP (UPF0339 family)